MEEHEPEAGKPNLYVYDTDAEAEGRKPLGLVAAGAELPHLGQPEQGRVQTTPDGRFLVFSTPEALAGDLNTEGCPSHCATAVYRYDAETGELTWVSHSASEAGGSSYKDEESQGSYEGEGAGAEIAEQLGETVSTATASIEDRSREISGEGEGEGETPHGHDGEYIVFTTAEKLQADDTSASQGSCAPLHPGGTVRCPLEVYLWHEGTVRMVSDGHDPQGVGNEGPSDPVGRSEDFSGTAMSASGSDVFFTTRTELLPRDTDDLRDVYDARIDGGFPEPVRASCPPEVAGGCQGSPPPPPPATAAPTSFFPAGGNLLAPLASSLAFKTTSKPLTRAQKLASALKVCRKKHQRKQRVACERQAKRTYGAKKTAKKARRSESRGGPGDARTDRNGRRPTWTISPGCVARRLRARGLRRHGARRAAAAVGSHMTHKNAYAPQERHHPGEREAGKPKITKSQNQGKTVEGPGASGETQLVQSPPGKPELRASGRNTLFPDPGNGAERRRHCAGHDDCGFGGTAKRGVAARNEQAGIGHARQTS